MASDKTGEIGIVLMDRPIRTLFGKRVYELEDEVCPILKMEIVLITIS